MLLIFKFAYRLCEKNTKRFRTQFSIANGQFMKWPGTLRPNPPKVLWIMSLTWRKYRWVNIADQKSKNSCCSCSYINKHLRWNRKSKTNQGLWTCSTICHSFQFLCSIKNKKQSQWEFSKHLANFPPWMLHPIIEMRFRQEQMNMSPIWEHLNPSRIRKPWTFPGTS